MVDTECPSSRSAECLSGSCHGTGSVNICVHTINENSKPFAKLELFNCLSAGDGWRQYITFDNMLISGGHSDHFLDFDAGVTSLISCTRKI